MTGAQGTVPKTLIRSTELLDIGDIIASTQMTALLGIEGILRRAMNLLSISHSLDSLQSQPVI